eukprot:m.127732 g.127732  ORF g.127732 m.127732 type:complete len:405 (+) comp13855_c0_seq2:448-1662(+)
MILRVQRALMRGCCVSQTARQLYSRQRLRDHKHFQIRLQQPYFSTTTSTDYTTVNITTVTMSKPATSQVGQASTAVASSGTSLELVSPTGAFERKASTFRNWIAREDAVSGRYHLYISHACPWANRVHAVMKLKNLEQHIGLSIVHPTWATTKEGDDHRGWMFGRTVDTPHGGSFTFQDTTDSGPLQVNSIREIYDLVTDEQVTRSVPLLWDKEKQTIVNNESSELIRIFNTAFNHLPGVNADLDLYPPALQADIDAINDIVYPAVNNGVYRCGFARTQEAYEVAFDLLFQTLDDLEVRLSKSRYLVGNMLTEADIRLFMTLVRFDEVYVVYFKTNKKAIREYPNLWGYCQELYQMPAIRGSINMPHIKTHYFSSHPALNAYAIVPKGGDTLSLLKQPHGRDAL